MKVGDAMKHIYNGPFKVTNGDSIGRHREVVDKDGAEVCWCGHENPLIARAQALMICDALNNAHEMQKHFDSLLEAFSEEVDSMFAQPEDAKV